MVKKKHTLDVVLTLATGVLMCPIKDVLPFAGHVLGHTVFIHELADRDFWTTVREALCAQHPQLRDVEPIESDMSDADVQRYLKRQIAKYGAALSITRGTNKRTETPVESLHRIAPHMQIEVALAPDDTSKAR